MLLAGGEDILRERGIDVVNLGKVSEVPTSCSAILLCHRSPRVQRFDGEIY